MLRGCIVTAALAATTLPASAACPTNVRDLPASGFLASVTRAAMSEYNGTSQAANALPSLDANIGIASGIRAEAGYVEDAGGIAGTAALSSQVLARRRELTGCVSADVPDIGQGSARVAAAGQIPFLFTGIGVGLEIDRNILQPLTARRELLAAPVSRIAAQVSIAFIDLDLQDGDDRARILVMPTTVETIALHQATATSTLDRRTSRVETAMLRFVVRDRHGSGELGVFGMELEELEPVRQDTTARTGIVRVSIAALAVDRERWGLQLDGGVLSIGGERDCITDRCNRGFYLAALRRTWQPFSLEGRVERTGFMDATDEPAFEDRATVAVSAHGRSRTVTTSTFAARTKAWLRGTKVRSAGARVSLSQSLDHGLTALIDGELVRSDGDILAPNAGGSVAARGLVSLAWQRRVTR